MRWIASTRDFEIEITPNVEDMIKLLQEEIPSEDAFLYIFCLIYASDKLLSKIANHDPDLFEKIIDEDNDISQLSGLVFTQMDHMMGNQEEEE